MEDVLHHFHSHTLRALAIAAVLTALAQVLTQAAVTLTIDTPTKTYTWPCTATSDTFAVPENGTKSIRLGTGSWIGGNSPGSSGNGSLRANLAAGSGSSLSISSGFSAGAPWPPAPRTRSTLT